MSIVAYAALSRAKRAPVRVTRFESNWKDQGGLLTVGWQEDWLQ